MFSAAKDKLTSSAAKSYVNDLIKSYGRVEEFSIDSRSRRIEIRCQLDGEKEPIGICIDEYQLERQEGRVFARIVACTASRPWLQAAIRAHLLGRPLEVPPWMAAAL
jgi:hypothetical protein